jgi:hypothetical protein
MKTIDHIKESGERYKLVKKEIVLLEVPPMQFLMIDGEKDPNQNPEYSDAVGALYSVAYKLKFLVKKGPLAVDYKVMPLEGLWWAENMAAFSLENRLNWKWTMMIMQPDFITHAMFSEALENARSKKDNEKLEQVRFESFSEGLCMQIFHQGPYGEGERATIETLHSHITKMGYALFGKHHEIYFNSPLKTAPENLKTIIRQPVVKTSS